MTPPTRLHQAPHYLEVRASVAPRVPARAQFDAQRELTHQPARKGAC
ncbi:MAG: hypothetical protein ACRDGF_02240 [Chloroflexota bacterium]